MPKSCGVLHPLPTNTIIVAPPGDAAPLVIGTPVGRGTITTIVQSRSEIPRGTHPSAAIMEPEASWPDMHVKAEDILVQN